MSWESRVVETLVLLKRRGDIEFGAAWRLALKAHPPSARQFGYRETLFALDGDEGLSDVEWLRWATREAWHGERPVLTHLKGAVGLHEVQDAA